jgi:hypothetical protein
MIFNSIAPTTRYLDYTRETGETIVLQKNILYAFQVYHEIYEVDIWQKRSET